MNDEYDDEEKAVQFIMEFYNVSRDEAIRLYRDEIESYMSLMKKGIIL